MNNVRIIKLWILLALSIIFNLAHAASAPIVEGVDYTLLSAATTKTPTAKSDKVNIKEFFSFSCIHCRDVEPLIEGILLKNKHLKLDKIQVVWDDKTSSYAKLNATLQLLNLNTLYIPAFNAIFSQNDLTTTVELKTFLRQNGLSSKQIDDFMATYNSFTVSSMVSSYKELMNTYNITGTPTFVVADKYMVSPALPARLIEVIQYLVARTSK